MCFSSGSILQVIGIQNIGIQNTEIQECGEHYTFRIRTEISQTSEEIWEIKNSEILTCFKADYPTGHLEIDELTPLCRVWL